MNARSNSVGQIRSVSAWATENWRFFRMRVAGLTNQRAAMQALLAELDGYAATYKEVTGRSMRDATIFEIGYGARPLRLLALTSQGLNAYGIDLDTPMLTTSLGNLVQIRRSNGWLRFGKSAIRSLIFDRHERRALDAALGARGAKLVVKSERFLVGDVVNLQLPEGSVDLFYSEDVFEHIPLTSMDAVCASLAQALSENGVALISPVVFTGLSGGHLPEWYPHTLQKTQSRHSKPWEHLRDRRYTADCHLNEMRLSDFEALFARHFAVEAIRNLQPDHGRAFLSDEIRNELHSYSHEELLGYKWCFVLRRRPHTP
ncbi:class I SAM-dependent methyltransferase [Hydrogenophaga sp.]|uniref:class I SAM-dependent methyltransferase n=1 Tax=Hydrogenophaga sp. TaxID=1904254 RepID=UPI00260B4413|nr:class I SAM-dependent methyltransferase [Hydrogenophaga sp.]MDM7948611.1 class I SAM-dependent methyltransferase [Hydrogenophaga sp.]